MEEASLVGTPGLRGLGMRAGEQALSRGLGGKWGQATKARAEGVQAGESAAL